MQRWAWAAFVFRLLSLRSLALDLTTPLLHTLLSAEDRVGHVTQASSHRVIIDSTPPSVRHVIVGTTTQSMYVQADELHVHWAGVEDKESGVDSVEVSSARFC